MYPHTIDIESATTVNDGMGGYTETWSPFLSAVPAHVQPISGTEYYKAQQIQNPVDVDVFTPYNGAIKSDMRIKHDGQVLTIKAVLDQGGMNEVLLLKCAISNVSE